MLRLRPGPTFNDAAATYRKELEQWSEIIERVSDLFLRVNTRDAEVAATVYFAAQNLAHQTNLSEDDVMQEVKHWKRRRRPPLTDQEIAGAIRNLNLLNLIALKPSANLPVRGDFIELESARDANINF